MSIIETDTANMRILIAALMMHAIVGKDEGTQRIERVVRLAFELADEFLKVAESQT